MSQQSSKADRREYDVRQAAAVLGVSEFTLRRMLANMEIGHRRIGSGRGRIRILGSHIDAYLASRMHEAAVARA